MREDAGVDHDQFVRRARLAAEHEPAVADLGVDGEHQLGQLCFTDAPVEGRAELGDLRILRFHCEGRQMQRGIDRHASIGSGIRYGLHTGRGALE